MWSTLLKYTLGITVVIVLLAVLSMNFGIGMPSQLVSIALYGGMGLVVVRAVWRRVRQKKDSNESGV